MVALSAFAEHPERVENIFHNTEKNDYGIYAMNLYALGVPYTTYIDDYLPLRSDGRLHYAQVGSDQALWGPLIEKAIAKYVGNYFHTEHGINADGVGFLNGSPNKYIYHQKGYGLTPD